MIGKSLDATIEESLSYEMQLSAWKNIVTQKKESFLIGIITFGSVLFGGAVRICEVELQR